MTSDAHFEDRRTTEQAAWWLLTLQSEQLSATERAEFIDWLRESPLHIAEMLRVCRLERDFAGFEGAGRSGGAGGGRQLAAIVELRERGRVAAERGPPRQRMRNAVLMAASLAVLCLLGLF